MLSYNLAGSPTKGGGAAALVRRGGRVHLRRAGERRGGCEDYPGAFEFFEVVSLCVTYFVALGSSLLSPQGVNWITPPSPAR
jgi:hypothetical protein